MNTTRHASQEALADCIREAAEAGFRVTMSLTACGSCRDSLSRHGLTLPDGAPLPQSDLVQLLVEKLPWSTTLNGQKLLYHASCHPEWSGVKAVKGGGKAARALERLSGASIAITPGCCGESGTGAYTSPGIYNALRDRKRARLTGALPGLSPDTPILVGCPSCRLGISRTLMTMETKDGLNKRPVLHSAEWLAETLLAPECPDGNWLRRFRRQALRNIREGVRVIDMGGDSSDTAPDTPENGDS